jgi:Sulfotransferase domain
MTGEKIMRLPDFIGVGPARTGTTWLHEVLKGHVGLPLVKETQFFKRYYDKGLGWYASHFTQCFPDLPVGEICPSYFNSPEARQRIYEHLPRCKIICSLRDPVDRLYSHYRHIRPLSGISVDFEQALKETPELLDGSCYGSHLERWQRSFGKANVLVLFYEDIKADPQAYVNSVCAFIGIPMIDLRNSPTASEKVNMVEGVKAPRSRRLAMASGMVTAWLKSRRLDSLLYIWRRSGISEFCLGGGEEYGPLSQETQTRLRRYFQPEIEKLEALTHRDLTSWKFSPKDNEVATVRSLA